jgi:hypothetical protein
MGELTAGGQGGGVLGAGDPLEVRQQRGVLVTNPAASLACSVQTARLARAPPGRMRRPPAARRRGPAERRCPPAAARWRRQVPGRPCSAGSTVICGGRAGKLESSSAHPSGQPGSSVPAEGSPALPGPGVAAPAPVPAAVFHPVLRHLPFLPARARSGPPEAGDGWSPGLAPGPRSLPAGPARSGLDAWSDVLAAPFGMHPAAPPGSRRGTMVSARVHGAPG